MQYFLRSHRRHLLQPLCHTLTNLAASFCLHFFKNFRISFCFQMQYLRRSHMTPPIAAALVILWIHFWGIILLHISSRIFRISVCLQIQYLRRSHKTSHTTDPSVLWRSVRGTPFLYRTIYDLSLRIVNVLCTAIIPLVWPAVFRRRILFPLYRTFRNVYFCLYVWIHCGAKKWFWIWFDALANVSNIHAVMWHWVEKQRGRRESYRPSVPLGGFFLGAFLRKSRGNPERRAELRITEQESFLLHSPIKRLATLWGLRFFQFFLSVSFSDALLIPISETTREVGMKLCC